jgi:hypothetical protein
MSFIMFISSPGLWSSILKWTSQNVSSTDELCIAGHRVAVFADWMMQRESCVTHLVSLQILQGEHFVQQVE